ncbi:MAG: hypothetical protein F6K16_34345, partial [Symploca sp. SIO2B6]|nr:hypothetical protein [Symploca sp. SIO2B6]
METTFHRNRHSEDIRTLGTQIQTLLGDIPITIQCVLKEGRLVVLGQHTVHQTLNSGSVLVRLERSIQALNIRFAQQVRIYLRVAGQKQPYAHHRFILTPPPPPRIQKPSPIDEQPWIVGDEELSHLVDQLTAFSRDTALSTQASPSPQRADEGEPLQAPESQS